MVRFIDADHFEMCKFTSARDAGYLAIRDAIKCCMENTGDTETQLGGIAVAQDSEISTETMEALADKYYRKGHWKLAALLQEEVVKRYETRFGASPRTMTATSRLATTYGKRGQHAKAETLQKHMMEERKLVGEEHARSLSCKTNLATTYRLQGKLVEAESLQTEVVETSTRQLGEEDPGTLSAASNLALIYMGQNRFGEALKMQKWVVRI